MQKTKFDTIKEVKPKWHLLDAKDKILGHLAEEAGNILNGKLSAHFSPNQYGQDKVVIINSNQIRVTGNKLEDKLYIHHTGFPKGLRSQSLKEVMAKDSTKVIESAVSGMLPKNRLRKKKMAGLFVFKDEKHTHQANFGKVSK
ncbi:50S ribosomal protein L13 [candidate division WWE3 bacterium CG08_land_8_20_14_0_20_41_10]|uniref:Large ribosomal subunit protein uL13 n=1 Tax=candidate division WWE3 bacterium CG08_land_8_20_14_0_20_41_10 TaxID=1975085 RepID=A0A2H0XC57_UNCKA|nr:MAG: 50S ribosomal protein L13 [candidate division WWE3 bacterium CG08_land_8_20_14_0_20_41_10]